MEARDEPDGSLVLTHDSTRWGKVVLAATALLRDRSGLSLTEAKRRGDALVAKRDRPG